MKQITLLFSFCILFGTSFGYTNYIGSDSVSYNINEIYLEPANFLASQDFIVSHMESPQKYRLENTITRSELIGIALKLARVDLVDGYRCRDYFTDGSYDAKNNWVCRAAEIAADNGIVTRTNTRFRPNDTVTNSEALGILLKAKNISYEKNFPGVGYKSDVKQWQIDILEGAIKKGILKEYETYGFSINAPAIRGKIFDLAVKTLVASAEAKDLGYHYISSNGKVYHKGHAIPGVSANDFKLLEGDFFSTQKSVFKFAGCDVMSGCPEKTVFDVELDPDNVTVQAYHYIKDKTKVWFCDSINCKKIEASPAEFECLDNMYPRTLCGDDTRVYLVHGDQIFPNSGTYTPYGYNGEISQAYTFFLASKRYSQAEKMVSNQALQVHKTIVAKLKKWSIFESRTDGLDGGVSYGSINFRSNINDIYESINISTTIDQEKQEIESLYIQPNQN